MNTKSLIELVKHTYKDEDRNIQNLVSWLKSTPKFTTYRVNILKTNADKIVSTINKYFNESNVEKPKVYKLFHDTVVIEGYAGPDRSLSEKSYPEIIVDAACGAAVLRGSHIFAPGVMALPPSIQIDDIVYVYADLLGSCKKGLKVNFDSEKLFVGKGRLKMSRQSLFGENIKPSGIAVEITETASGVPVIDKNIFGIGDCLLQNLPSIVCSKVLNPKPGDFVLDMCAAPGNKTSHLAEMMNNTGLIAALEKVPNKKALIDQRCKEHNISCVHSFTFDSTKAINESEIADITNRENIKEIIIKGPPYPSNIFDKILLDAPCSALGQRPLLKCNLNLKMLDSYIPLQKNLFRAAVKLLKPSGRLVYSTCTITEGECEKLVLWAMENFPELQLVSAEPIFGRPGKDLCGLDELSRTKVQRFSPTNDIPRNKELLYEDTLGFFIACFEKL